MEIPLLREIVIIFALSIFVQLICHRLHIPTIVGFLITGVLAGPHGLGFVNNIEDVDVLATMGIVMLLFTVGMEFSLKKIVKYKKDFFIGGFLQVFLTVMTSALIAMLFTSSLGEAIALGFLVSLSSTAIVLRALDQRSQSQSPHGRLIVSILIFQDIVAIPMMLMIPSLSGQNSVFTLDNLLAAGKGIGILMAGAFLAIKLVPKLLFYVTLTRSRELFILSVLTICFSVAWVTSELGLSLSLGAFLAGLIVSESEYSNEAVGDVLPFQDIFTSFFFISIGMLLNISFVLEHPVGVILLTVGVILIKASMAGAGTLLLGMPLRTAVMTGVSLAQIGEFSFVLASVAMAAKLMPEESYQFFLAVSLLSMAFSPWLIKSAPQLYQLLTMLPLPQKLKSGLSLKEEMTNALENHVIIAGYGVAGRHLASSCKRLDIPYTIIEMNSETVRRERKLGEPIAFGDASHPAVLEHAHIETAHVIAIVINDPVAALRIVRKVRQINDKAHIIARTRYLLDAEPFYKLGANEVVVEELGAAVEVFSRVLGKYEVELSSLEAIVDELMTQSPKIAKQTLIQGTSHV